MFLVSAVMKISELLFHLLAKANKSLSLVYSRRFHANILKFRFCQAGLTRKASLEEYANKSLKCIHIVPYGTLETYNTGLYSSGRVV